MAQPPQTHTLPFATISIVTCAMRTRNRG
jgi:hypothetical protein